MQSFHLYFLCALVFYGTAIVLAFSNAALMAVFVALGGMCTVVGILQVPRKGDEEG